MKAIPFRRTLLEMLVLCGLGFAVYGPALEAPFLYDDTRVVALSRTLLAEAGPSTGALPDRAPQAMPLWKQPRPLRQLSHAFDLALFGDSPAAARAVNVLLHVLAAFLGGRLLAQIGLSRSAAFLASTVFLVLPVCVESVAIVSHRKEMLAALFLIPGLRLALRGGRSGWLLAGLCFALAVASKETALVFPLLFLVLAAARRRQDAARPMPDARVWRASAPLLAFALALALASWLQIRAGVAIASVNALELGSDRFGHLTPDAPWTTAFRLSLWAFGRYLLMIASPAGHSLHAAIPLRGEGVWTASAPALLAAGGFAAATITAWRRRSECFAPLLWIAASLSIAVFPPLMRSGATSVYADRYAYLAAFGHAWLVAAVIERVRAGRRPNAAVWLAVPLAAAYAVGAHLNARHFRSEEALWSHVAARNPNDYQAQYNLAHDAWKRRNDRDQALARFRRMSELRPGFVFGHCAFSEFLAETGSGDEAMRLIDECLALRPDSAQLHAQRGMYRLTAGDFDGAAADFAKAMRLGADEPVLLHNYGMAQEGRARWKEAAALYARATRAPAFHDDALRVQLLTRDPPRNARGQADRRILVADAASPPGAADGAQSPGARLAALLDARSGAQAPRFHHAALAAIPDAGIAPALSERLKASPRFTDCLLVVDLRDAAPGGGAEAAIRKISRGVMSCRINGARPIIVRIDAMPAEADGRPSNPEARALDARLRAFCADARVVLIAAPDGAADLTALAGRILDLLRAESL